MTPNFNVKNIQRNKKKTVSLQPIEDIHYKE